MREIPKERVVKRLQLENPWWTEGQSIHDFYQRLTPRGYFGLLQRLVDSSGDPRRAVVLMGPRRVGKTVMIHHLIDALLANGASNTSIFYVSIDHPLYLHLDLEQLVQLAKDATGVAPTHIFFDEIQYLPDWERHLKVLVDSDHSAQFLASGSAAAALRMKSLESGAGRFTDFFLSPLSFHEYLMLTGNAQLITGVDDNGWDTTADIDTLNQHFLEYLNIGGYPEALFSAPMRLDPQRYIEQDIIDKVLLRDLPSLYGITDVQELNSLFTTLAFNTGQEVSLEKLSKNSGVSKATIKKYIEYLEAAFLLRRVPKIDRQAKRFKRQNHFKIYLTNPSIRSALFSPVEEDDDDMGALIETAIFAQWFHTDTSAISYARWKSGEVDMVSGVGDEVNWCLEVKWSNHHVTRHSELAHLVKFCQLHNLRDTLVTTRDQSAQATIENVNVTFVPASLYCSTVGRNMVAGLYSKAGLLGSKAL